jgi:hypothetical protein
VPARTRAVADAIPDERGAARWSAMIARERGGISAAVVELLAGMTGRFSENPS